VREDSDAECPATTSARGMTISDAGAISTKPDDSQEQ
jgi:hypothetical protein